MEQIMQIRRRCNEEARLATQQRQQDNNIPTQYKRVSPMGCLFRNAVKPESRWLFAKRLGSWWEFFDDIPDDSDVLLFAPMDDANPQPSHPDEVAVQCSKREELAQLIDCTTLHRWELLQ
jgi:hypothetical protein